MPETTVQWKDDSEAIGEVLYLFEKDFREGKNPTIEHFLQGEGPARQKLLIELLHSDLELRLRAGQSISAANYLPRFPELAQQPDMLAALLATEVRVLKQIGTPLQADAYQNAYGQYLGSRVKDILEVAIQAPKYVDALIGTVIGKRYKIIKPLGQGGMGTVYLAEQLEPVRRQVALKVIKGGRDSQAVIARFEAERQALAVMDHPNIARVYDGGSTDLGQPYFVMELVEGLPVTKYCDQQRLTPNARLELFVAICQAVQHAHQKGIIHRDLKPSNVLVTAVDGKPVPKVIDFGVAKATEQNLLEQTLEETGIVGTPIYMSPEQADRATTDIDTRTDIYALGVMLYEMLTGFTPIAAADFKRHAIDEMYRMLREVDPPKPSTKISSAEELPNIAANRNMEPRQLVSWLQNDIDWIVMKALEKDRDRRYETANGFAADVMRYLNSEPVTAHPPSRWYLARKFIRRNKGMVLAASLVLLVLVGGIIGTSIGLYLANEAAKKEKAANELSSERLRQIESINNHVFDIFSEFDIRNIKDGPDPVEHVLAERLIEAGKKLDAKAIHDPLVLANLRNRLGATLLSLGKPQAAVDFLISARSIRLEKLGENHPETLESMNILAMGYREIGKLESALPLFEETLKLRKTILGIDHHDTLISMSNLASSYQVIGKLEVALPLLEEIYKLMKARLGHDHFDTLISMSNLASAYQKAGKMDLALPLLEEALMLSKVKVGIDHLDTQKMMGNLASFYRDSGKLDLALPLLEETLRLNRAKLGAGHPISLTTMNNLALVYKKIGKMDMALPLYEETLKLRKARLGTDHPDTLTSIDNLAFTYIDILKFDLAIPLLEEALKLRKSNLGTDHPDTILNMNNLAGLYYNSEKLDLALPLFQQAATGIEKQGFKHEKADRIIPSTINAYEQAMKYNFAENWRRKWLAHIRAKDGTKSSNYADELAGLGSNLLKQKKWSEAETTLREALVIFEKTQPDNWTYFNTQSELGGVLLMQKKFSEAEMLLLNGYKGLKLKIKSIPHQDNVNVSEALNRLIQLYTETNKPEELKKWQAEKAKLTTDIEKSKKMMSTIGVER